MKYADAVAMVDRLQDAIEAVEVWARTGEGDGQGLLAERTAARRALITALSPEPSS